MHTDHIPHGKFAYVWNHLNSFFVLSLLPSPTFFHLAKALFSVFLQLFFFLKYFFLSLHPSPVSYSSYLKKLLFTNICLLFCFLFVLWASHTRETVWYLNLCVGFIWHKIMQMSFSAWNSLSSVAFYSSVVTSKVTYVERAFLCMLGCRTSPAHSLTHCFSHKGECSKPPVYFFSFLVCVYPFPESKLFE